MALVISKTISRVIHWQSNMKVVKFDILKTLCRTIGLIINFMCKHGPE